MHHLILGYGYCGYYLARELLQQKQEVTAVSRHLNDEWSLPGLNHRPYDLKQALQWTEPDTIIYYLIPPPSQGSSDSFLKEFLTQSEIRAKRIIYFGTSGVYGNHQGAWVNEESACLIESQRQLRRLDAEQQWKSFSEYHSVDCINLRIAGIYGPGRIPVDAAKERVPLIIENEAPYTNHIYVKDLARIAFLLSQSPMSFSTYNISDGVPHRMGSLQSLVADTLHLEPAPYESWDKVYEEASPMKREFMRSSRRLNIDRLNTVLGTSLSITPFTDGVLQSLA